MEYLVATLAAPLASFGGPAANEARKDAGGPMRSAIVGLLSACMGFDRAAREEMAELSRRIGILVRMDRPGDTLTDYHTTQSASEGAEKRWAKAHGRTRPTRRQYLVSAKAVDEVDTSLSEREYRTDAVATLVLWERGGAGESGLLRQVQAAMRRPVFLPTLGRKACHLGLPMNPRIVESSDAVRAMEADPVAGPLADARGRIFERDRSRTRVPRSAADFLAEAVVLGNARIKAPVACHCDMDAELGKPEPASTLAFRRDEPRDRGAWTFSERREKTFHLPAAGEAA